MMKIVYVDACSYVCMYDTGHVLIEPIEVYDTGHVLIAPN